MREGIRMLLVVLGVAGCGAIPSSPAADPQPAQPSPAILPGEAPTPSPVPSSPYMLVPFNPPSPTPSPVLRRREALPTRAGRITFADSIGDFKDVRQDGYDFPWLYPGNWFSSGGRLVIRDLLPQPNLSFRRYAGTAFGADGALPDRYRARVTVRFEGGYDSPSAYPPTGDQGTPFFYLDPTHYVELLIKPDRFEVWECDGGQPEKGGWRQLYQEPLVTERGDSRTLGVEVDASAGRIVAFLNGNRRAEVSSHLITPGYHSLALRAAGNAIALDDFLVESM